jgi:hypothetical protein
MLSCSGSKTNSTDGTEITETAQQVGDVMASVDEVGGSAGSIAFFDRSVRNTFARYAPSELNENAVAKLFLPEAQATTCNGNGFAACSGKSMTRNFAGCSIGTAVFTGSVVSTWAGTGTTTCALNQLTNTITRSPQFTVEGRRGATLTVAKATTTGTGQTLTWASGSGASKVYNLTNDGIRRSFTSNVGAIVYDHTTTITTPIQITGSLRSARVMDTGTVEVKNNITNVTCSFTPMNVTWGSPTCNCPTQGTWQGSCSNSKSLTLSITGCGTANYTEGTQTDPVTFDRCGT